MEQKAEGSDSGGVFECHLCPQSYSSRWTLHTHINFAHLERNPYPAFARRLNILSASIKEDGNSVRPLEMPREAEEDKHPYDLDPVELIRMILQASKKKLEEIETDSSTDEESEDEEEKPASTSDQEETAGT